MLLSSKSPFSVLQHKNFRLLWLGLLISRIGSEMQVVAINWHVYLLTHSALSLSIIGLARFLPLLIFSLFSGILADTFNRKKLLLIANIITTLTAALLSLATFSHHISTALIYLMLAINSLATSFEIPVRQSLLPYLVPKEKFMSAVSLTTIMFQTATVLGPAIVGFTIAFWGVGTVYLVNALSFFAVIIAILLMDPVNQPSTHGNSFQISRVLEGLSFVRKTPIISGTMILDFFATFFSSAQVLMPVFAKDILKVGAQGLGFLYAASAIGSILAGFIISFSGRLKNQGKIMLVAVTIYGLSITLFGLSRSFYLSLFFLLLSGLGDGLSTILRNAIRQLATPDHLRGRMVSINQIFFIGGPQLGEVEAGLVAGFVNTPFAVISGGIATILTTITLTFLVPQIRRYQGHEHLEIV